MEHYYFAGYFLIKPEAGRDFGVESLTLEKLTFVHTCSECVNTSVFDYWDLANNQLDNERKNALGLTDGKIKDIQRWISDKFNQGLIKFDNAFPDLKTVTEFKNLFFSHLPDAAIYSLYLDSTDAHLLTNH